MKNETRQIVAPGNFYSRYTRLVEKYSLPEALQEAMKQIEQADLPSLLSLRDRVYTEGKWTIRDIFQHLIDTERIMTYRALRFSRQDKTPLPGFDENHYAATVNTTKRPLEELLSEFKNLRQSTMDFFNSLDESELHQKGVCFQQEVTVEALGYIIAGHQQHHFNIIEERYKPLLHITRD